MKTTAEKPEKNPEEANRKMKLFVFGNPLVEEDALAIKVAEKLKESTKLEGQRGKAAGKKGKPPSAKKGKGKKAGGKRKAASAKNKGKKGIRKQEIQIIRTMQPEDLLDEEKPVILDVVKGIEKVRLITPSQLKQKKPFAAHDFDLQSFIQLAMRLGDLKGVRIIGIPMGYPLEKAVSEVKALLFGAD